MKIIDLNYHLQVYENYSWLWTDDKQEYLSYFLKFAQYINPEQREMIEQHPEYLPENLKEKKPDLKDFKREIDYFIDLYNECDKLQNEEVLCQWLRLDIKPFKQTLLNVICKWSNVLKDYLVKRITTQ